MTKRHWRLAGGLIFGALVLAALLWILVDQMAWHFRWRAGSQGNYLDALAALSTFAAALFTMLAAIGAGLYVVLTYFLWQATRSQVDIQKRIAETALMQSLMVRYDDLRNDIEVVHDYYLGFPTKPNALTDFKNAKAIGMKEPAIKAVDDSRFRVSRFFVGLRKLSNAGYLDRRVIAAALSREAMEDVFLEEIDPLDQEISQLVRGRPNITDRDFFRELVRDRQALLDRDSGS